MSWAVGLSSGSVETSSAYPPMFLMSVVLFCFMVIVFTLLAYSVVKHVHRRSAITLVVVRPDTGAQSQRNVSMGATRVIPICQISGFGIFRLFRLRFRCVDLCCCCLFRLLGYASADHFPLRHGGAHSES